MKSIVLPIKYPEFTAYPIAANSFAIMSGNGADYLNWFISNYIQLYSYPVKENSGLLIGFIEQDLTALHLYSCPFIDLQLINRDILKLQGKDIFSFIFEMLASSYYLYMDVNQYYIPDSGSYKKSPFNHGLLIYGVDYENQLLYVADNFASGNYKFTKCSFSEFEEAYNTTNVGFSLFANKIVLLKYIAHSSENDLNLNKIVDLINNYLISKDTIVSTAVGERYNNFTFGIQVYTTLNQYLQGLSKNLVNYDIRPLHALYEHKRIMFKRLEHLINQQLISNSTNIIEEYEKVVNESLINRNLLLKYQITNDISIINKIIASNNLIVEKEQELLSYVTQYFIN